MLSSVYLWAELGTIRSGNGEVKMMDAGIKIRWARLWPTRTELAPLSQHPPYKRSQLQHFSIANIPEPLLFEYSIHLI